MAKKLKVYRTAAGFHDAYVAAPSRAAALRAWGAERDLFALGSAEEVTDTRLMEAPLASPGEVVKVARSDDGEEAPPPRAKKTKAAKPVARPSRAALDKAEAALEKVATEFDARRAEIDRRETALAAERRKIGEAEDKARDKAQAALDQVRATYDEKLEAWRQASG